MKSISERQTHTHTHTHNLRVDNSNFSSSPSLSLHLSFFSSSPSSSVSSFRLSLYSSGNCIFCQKERVGDDELTITYRGTRTQITRIHTHSHTDFVQRSTLIATSRFPFSSFPISLPPFPFSHSLPTSHNLPFSLSRPPLSSFLSHAGMYYAYDTEIACEFRTQKVANLITSLGGQAAE